MKAIIVGRDGVTMIIETRHEDAEGLLSFRWYGVPLGRIIFILRRGFPHTEYKWAIGGKLLAKLSGRPGFLYVEEYRLDNFIEAYPIGSTVRDVLVDYIPQCAKRAE